MLITSTARTARTTGRLLTPKADSAPLLQSVPDFAGPRLPVAA